MSTPAPATTNWVPIWNLQGGGQSYLGLWVGPTGSAFAGLTPSTTSTGTYSLGDRIRFLAAGQITAIRFWRVATSPTSRSVRIYDLAGNLLSSATSTESGGAGWVQVTLPTPINVNVNDERVIAIDVASGGTFAYTPGPVLSSNPAIAYVVGRYVGGIGAFPTSEATNWYATDVVFGGTNVPYQPGQIVVDNGIEYVCVRTTTKRPTPWSQYGNMNNPIARVSMGTVSIPNAAWTQITSWPLVDYDTDNIWDAANYRMLIRTAGRYRVAAQIVIAGAGVGSAIRGLQINKNSTAGNTGVVAEGAAPSVSGYETPLFAQADVALQVGDWLAVLVYQNSGGAVTQGSAASYFSIERLDAAIPVPVSYPAGVPTIGATPPASPVDGQIWMFPVDAANGVMWHFRYNAGSSSPYKWEFIGGPPYYSGYAGADTIATANAWTYPSANNCDFLATRSGDYMGYGQAVFQLNAANPGWFLGVANASISPNPPGVYSGMYQASTNVSTGVIVNGTKLIGISGGQTLRLVCYTTQVNPTFSQRSLTIIPVRVS